MRDWIGVTCLMSSQCKPHRTTLTFIVGAILGLTIGCALTITYTLQLAKVEKTDFYRFPRIEPRMFMETAPPIIQETVQVPHLVTTTETITISNEFNSTHKEQVLTDKHKLIEPLPDISSFQPNSKYHLPYQVAVIATNSLTSRIETIYDTWGRDVTGITFYTKKSEEYNQLKLEGVPVVQLEGLSDEPHRWKNIVMILRHLRDNYYNNYNWFVLASDSVYISAHDLQELLLKMNSEHYYYFGHPVFVSWTNDPFYYCTSQLGVVISRSLLNHLLEKIDECDDIGNKWDYELGLCVRSITGTQCGENMKELSDLFITNINKSNKHLWDDYEFLKGVLVGPVQTDEQFYTLDYFFKTKLLKILNDKANELSNQLRQVCQNLPQAVLNKETVQNFCTSLKLEGTPDDEDDDMIMNHPVNIPASKFHPHNRFQVQAWHYFDAINIYQDENIMPRRSLKTYKYHSMELQKALQEAVKAASRQHHAKLRFKRIINGYVRHNALIGNEYIIDAKFVEARNPRKRIEKRIRLLRPLSTSYVVQPSKSEMNETIHFIVPITRVTTRFEEFLKMYEKLVLLPQEKVHLVLSVYGEDDVQQIKENLTLYYKKFPKAEITIVQGFGEFSRAKALDLGMSKLHDDNLAFFCDVDMKIDPKFLVKCRRNTRQRHSVYYPEVFKLYNRKYVYRNGWHPRKHSISREQGHWGYYAYGMLCIYKSDYKAVGGLDVAMVGWGGEDVDLYERVLRSGLDVLRSPDSSLIHNWHSKSCKMQSSSKMLEHCLMSQSEVLADRRELARYIFDIQDQLSNQDIVEKNF